MNVYIDTSAYVKEYHDEAGSELVHSVFESAKSGDALLITSLWTISESINTIDRHFMCHELNKEEYNNVLGAIFTDMFEMFDNKNLNIVDIDTNLVKMSWEYISSEHLSAADSLHLVTAMKSNTDVFYAADKKLIGIARKRNLNAVDVEEI